MKNSTAVITWLTLITIPLVCWLLIIVTDWGLIPLFVESVYFLPISWIGVPYFQFIPDIGAHIATEAGRSLGIVVYSAIFWSAYVLLKTTNKKS